MAVGLSLVFGAGHLGVPDHKSLKFLMSAWMWPSVPDFLLMTLLGTMAAVAMPLFAYAYKVAEPSFVAPFEYTAMFWAVLWGVLVFGDFPIRRDVERRGRGASPPASSCCIWTRSICANERSHTG